MSKLGPATFHGRSLKSLAETVLGLHLRAPASGEFINRRHPCAKCDIHPHRIDKRPLIFELPFSFGERQFAGLLIRGLRNDLRSRSASVDGLPSSLRHRQYPDLRPLKFEIN
ncbi:hypothetical protein [Burkholderia ubonensis]|uniref:hypothetical protein n=1 Tax=Burkholderia ubonensis TaxID=101571 RepID=UPI0018DF020F|nr:hypothetical protein [Burkholderia ubonensis]